MLNPTSNQNQTLEKPLPNLENPMHTQALPVSLKQFLDAKLQS